MELSQGGFWILVLACGAIGFCAGFLLRTVFDADQPAQRSLKDAPWVEGLYRPAAAHDLQSHQFYDADQRCHALETQILALEQELRELRAKQPNYDPFPPQVKSTITFPHPPDEMIVLGAPKKKKKKKAKKRSGMSDGRPHSKRVVK